MPRKGKVKTLEQQLSSEARKLFTKELAAVKKRSPDAGLGPQRTSAMRAVGAALNTPIMRFRKEVLSALTSKVPITAIAGFSVMSAIRGQDGGDPGRGGGSPAQRQAAMERYKIRGFTTMRLRGFVMDASAVEQTKSDIAVLNNHCSYYIPGNLHNQPQVEATPLTAGEMGVRDFILKRMKDPHFLEHYQRGVHAVAVLFGYNLWTEKKASKEEVDAAVARLTSRGCGDH